MKTAKLAVLFLAVAVIAFTLYCMANGYPVDRVPVTATVTAMVLVMFVPN